MLSTLRDTAVSARETRRTYHCSLSDAVLARLASVIPVPEILLNLPVMETILSLKAERDAVVVAHHRQTPLPRQASSAPQPDCPLSESLDAAYVRGLREAYPGLPLVTFVNTSAEVKAEADICCTAANAAAVARSLGVPRLIMVPDRSLGRYVAQSTGIEVVTPPAVGCSCEYDPCTYLQSITPFAVACVLEDECNTIQMDDAIGHRARRALERMLALE